MQCQKSSTQREIHRNTGIPQKRKISKQLKPPSNLENDLENEEQTKPKISEWMEMIKFREVINKIEIQKTKEKKSIKPRVGSVKRSTKLKNLWLDLPRRG